MPWDKRKKGDEWEVYNTETGDVKGTHPSEEKASNQLAALYIHADPEKETKMDKLEKTIFIPIAKIDEQRHEVWGFATTEAVDNADEVMDYASSKPHFVDWSKRAEKRTGGKSKGNIRAMHQPIAAGILLEMRPDDAAKGFYIGAKVTDENEWGKVITGTYSGFSIGGSYMKRWSDPTNPGKIRYTAKPAEISLVDSPCNPEATFDVVKADGSVAKTNFKSGEGNKILVIRKVGGVTDLSDFEIKGKATPETLDNFKKFLSYVQWCSDVGHSTIVGMSIDGDGSDVFKVDGELPKVDEENIVHHKDFEMIKVAGGYEDLRQKLQAALQESFPYKGGDGDTSPAMGSRFWIDDWNGETVWVCEGQKYYEIHYTLGEDGSYNFGQPMEVTRTISFTPVSQPEVAKADALGAPEPTSDITLDSEVGPDYSAEKMPQPNTAMELKEGQTPSQESLAGHTVFAENVEAVMNAWLPKIGKAVEDRVNKVLDERGFTKEVVNTATAPTQKIPVIRKSSNLIKVVRKESTNEAQK